MSGDYPPLTCNEIKAILAYLGFVHDTQKGSHEKWVMIKSMAVQAGVSKNDFYAILKKL